MRFHLHEHVTPHIYKKFTKFLLFNSNFAASEENEIFSFDRLSICGMKRKMKNDKIRRNEITLMKMEMT